jgi:hypothetical protein
MAVKQLPQRVEFSVQDWFYYCDKCGCVIYQRYRATHSQVCQASIVPKVKGEFK